MSEPRAVIWDVDGTLIDPSNYHWIAWKKALARQGYNFTSEDFTRTFGLRNDSILRMLLGSDVTAETIGSVETFKEGEYRRQVRESGIELLPGVASLLVQLQQAGWLQAVGSSAPPANIDLVLDVTGTRQYFAVILSGPDVKKGKPDPEVYFEAAARLSVPAQRCVVVEDAPDAIAGSMKAGFKTVAVNRSGQTPQADVRVSGLDQVGPSTFELLVPS